MISNEILLVGFLFIARAVGQCSLCSNNNNSVALGSRAESNSSASFRPNTRTPTATQQTCQELDEFLAESIPVTNTSETVAACKELRDQESADFQLSEFCGCPEDDKFDEEEEAPAPPTGTCGFCSLENVYDVNRTIDDGGIWTCGDLAEMAPFVKSSLLCDDFQKSIPLCCSDFVSTCSVCGEGSTLTLPDRVLQWAIVENTTTCDVANQYLAIHHKNEDACNSAQEEMQNTNGVDLASYCGCSGAEPPNTCQFCSADNLWDADLIVYNDTTCGHLAERAPFVTSTEMCEEDFQSFLPLCCLDFEPTCTICQEGSQMAQLDRIIPGTDQTCALADRYVGMIQANEPGPCQTVQTQSEDSSSIHLTSFCGCEGAEPPGICSFCSVEKLIDPAFIVDETDSNLTCGYLAEVAPHITGSELCDDFLYFAPLCCADFQPTCSICSSVANDGASLTKPDTLIPGLENTTCAEMDRYFGLIQDNATACNAMRVESSPDIDIAAFCGCPAEDPPNICDFCSGEDLLDPNKIIGDGNETRSCGFLANVAPYIANETLCSWLEYAKPECCDMSVKEPCTVCNGVEMGLPDRIVEYEKGTTCADLDNRLRQLPEEICKQVTADWDIDLESYCGCEGSFVLDTCHLCENSHVLKNHLKALPDRPSWNCRVGHENARFITNDQVCTSEIRTTANLELCCEPIPPTISPAPTVPRTFHPTKAPTKEGSDARAHSFFVLMSILAMMTVFVLPA
eukprot:scaffold5605_cov128-Cylindrotheca_fusiformis.AAC.5